MDTLFTRVETAKKLENAPLAVRMRPTTLDGYVGQEKAVGPGSWLRGVFQDDVEPPPLPEVEEPPDVIEEEVS